VYQLQRLSMLIVNELGYEVRLEVALETITKIKFKAIKD